MKLGFVLPNNWGIDDAGAVADLAVRAEEAGLDSVWVNHHVINIGYIADRLGDRPYHDALTMLTWVAARTDVVRLGTSVLVMPYLHPMVTAKALATLDRLSGGRVVAGLGVGSLPEENAVLGVDYAGRGARSDEFIRVMRSLWGDGPSSSDEADPLLTAVVASPKPVQVPLPIWIGGSGGPAQRRAARFGQGWHPMCSVGGLAKRMRGFVDALEAAGRSREDIVVAPRIDVGQVPDHTAVATWVEAGADQLIVGVGSSDLADHHAAIAHLASL
jgi:probable F420-dependent oxidoreductase